MGADGGVCWLHVHGSKAKLLELLAPWTELLLSLKGSDWGEDSRYEWMEKNLCDGPHELFGGAGDDMMFPTLLDLERWLDLLEEAIQCTARDIGPDATFQDLLDERASRPSTQDFGYLESRGYGGANLISEWMDWLKYHPEAKAQAFLSQKIGHWCKSVRKEITGAEDGTFFVHYEETWT